MKRWIGTIARVVSQLRILLPSQRSRTDRAPAMNGWAGPIQKAIRLDRSSSRNLVASSLMKGPPGGDDPGEPAQLPALDPCGHNGSLNPINARDGPMIARGPGFFQHFFASQGAFPRGEFHPRHGPADPGT